MRPRLPFRIDAEAFREDLPCVEVDDPREDLLPVKAEAPLRDDLLRAELVLRLRDSPVLRPLADLLFELLDELPLDELLFEPALLADPLFDAALLDLLLPDLLLPDLPPDDEDRALPEREDDDRELLRVLLLDRCAIIFLLPLFFAMRTRTPQDANHSREYWRIRSLLCVPEPALSDCGLPRSRIGVLCD